MKESKEKEEKLKPNDISDLANELPEIKAASCIGCTPLDELLAQMSIGTDNATAEQQNYEINEIKIKFHKVKFYYGLWKNKDIYQINSWARKMKGHLSDTDSEICETIAIMDRAFCIITGGWRFRDPQILSVLIFLHSDGEQGRLCEIKTGEGKTFIVALVAIIKCLQGQTVDVMTSNPLLADDGVSETEQFYSVFGITVATNNPSESSNPLFKIEYTADILYGTISNFQFDFLKDTLEGSKIRRNREFGLVILDEVDSLLIDQGGHIAKLASAFPGMNYLRYIYINIWLELHKAEEKFAKKVQEEIEQILNKYQNEEAERKCEEYLEKMTPDKQRQMIKEMIIAAKPTNTNLMPSHLEVYVKNKIDVWIKNAIYAKYNCIEGKQYRIILDANGEKIVAPVDYENTGVTMKNTIWSNGLHQFIQLKHNIFLTFESLTSSFISNIGYIRHYKDCNIFGMTGTLGSTAEQNFLASIYNINFAKIPTFKKKDFIELPGIIVDDENWLMQITLEILKKIDDRRAVLVISETMRDLDLIRQNLEILQDENFHIKIFANEEDVEVVGQKVDVGDIILSTNIAGRGTNFKTQKGLERNGGLHVCVGFLPCNLRVEGQAFGRTARQGNKGTAQLVIRRSEVEQLGIVEENVEFFYVKAKRDIMEQYRLHMTENNLIKELTFKDDLYIRFAELHRNEKQGGASPSENIILEDLKECWAFWLENQNFNVETIKKTTPREEFNKFLEIAKPILDGKITHNPYYCIALANLYINNDKKKEAQDILEHALKMHEGKNSEILTGVHIKLFELAILFGEVYMSTLNSHLPKFLQFNVDDSLDNYKLVAHNHLQSAFRSIDAEISYLKNITSDENSDSDFPKIIEHHQNNYLLKHFHARQYCLEVHRENVEHMMGQLKKEATNVDFDGKVPTNIDNFVEISDGDVKDILTPTDIFELRSIGIDAIFSLREIPEKKPNPDILIYGTSLITGGMVFIGIALIFPPFALSVSSVAVTMICEGIMEIFMEVLFPGTSTADFIKGKLIDFAISIFTLGITAIVQTVKIIKSAITACRKFSSFLSKSTHLKKVSQDFRKWLDKIGDKLEKRLDQIYFGKLSKTKQIDVLQNLQKKGDMKKFKSLGGSEKLNQLIEQVGMAQLTSRQLLKKVAKDIASTTSKNVEKTIIEQVIFPIIAELKFGALCSYIMEQIKNEINRNSELIEKIKSTLWIQIESTLDEFLAKDEVLQITEKIVTGVLKNFNNKTTKTIVAVITLANHIRDIEALDLYCQTSVSYLEKHLPGGIQSNNVENTIDKICGKLEEAIFSLLTSISIYQDKLLQKGMKKLYSESMKQEKRGRDAAAATGSSQLDKRQCYEILGLDFNAPLNMIKEQYRKLALWAHPSTNPHDSKAGFKFRLFTEAYTTLVGDW